MSARRGCGLAASGCLLMLIVLAVFAALIGGMIWTGEVPLYEPRLIRFQPDPPFAFRPTTPLTLTFDQPMDTASVQAAFSVEPPVPGTFRWRDDRRQVVFTPDPPGYEPGATYTVRLAAGAKAGTIPRTTRQSKEWTIQLAPLLAAQSPERGAADQAAYTPLRATFNYPLDCASTLSTFALQPAVKGELRCYESTVVFTPTASLQAGTTYHGGLAHVFIKDDPTPRDGVYWTFTTAPPLTVLDVSPPPDVPWCDLRTPIRITFNRPVLPDSVADRFALTAEDGSPVPGLLTVENGGSLFTFRPDPALIPASRYRLTLRPGVQDALGFTTAEGVERVYVTGPMVGEVEPLPDARQVPLDGEIRIAFTRPMDRAGVEAGLTVEPPLDGAFTWEENTLIFTPAGGFAAETEYRVSLSAEIRDAGGAPLARPLVWSFRTQPFLLDAAPEAEMALTRLRQPVEFTFALPMDRASVEAALTVSPAIPLRAEWSNGNRTVAFWPDPAWEDGVEYKVVLSGAARTADGAQTLGRDRTLTFATAVARVWFGSGPNVQVMDAAGERTFQVIAQGADVADFLLYPITLTRFLDLYRTGSWAEPPLSVTLPVTPAIAWRGPLDPLTEGRWDDSWLAQASLPADVPPGLYLLSTDPPAEQEGYLLVVLTRHALVLKRSLAGQGESRRVQVVAWDTELGSGAPVVGATVRLYDREGIALAQGQTDADGLLTLDLPGDPAPWLVTAERDGDLTLCLLDDAWSEGGWWAWWQPPQPRRPLYRTYAYTDRPLYRPGQTLYFKDWIRADDDVTYTLPGPEQPVAVRLRDARDNVVARRVLTPTAFGTVFGRFALAPGAMPGTWSLETEVGGERSRHSFQVEEYRKPEFSVALRTPRKIYVVGEPITLSLEAAYYFGQPVAGAEVALDILALYPDDLWGDEIGPSFGPPLLTLEGRTDEQGRWQTFIPTDALFAGPNSARRVALGLEATVRTEVGPPVGAFQTVLVHRSDQNVALFLRKHRYEPGETISFTVQVRDLEGRPLAERPLTVRVSDWTEREVASATAVSDEAGQAHFSVALTEQGWYRLSVVGQEDLPPAAQEWLWIYDPTGQAPWRDVWGAEEDLRLIADAPEYAVGDEARLVIYTQTPGPALLTFERGRIHGTRPVTLGVGANPLTLSLPAAFAPNIYAVVNRFGPPGTYWGEDQTRPEAELHTAETQLLLPPHGRRLTVTLTADAETYAPGEEATFHLHVTDAQGRPVVAEVSLGVVDEALYALAEDATADPFDFFYGPRPNLVRTFDSMRPRRWLLPPGLGGGEAAAKEGEAEGGSRPRRTFLDTAFWAPAVVTDAEGRATVTFALPDNLTAWRVLARAVTTDTLVGQAVTRVTVEQQIVLRPGLPRFLVQGDTLTLTAEVHNFTAQAVSATVELLGWDAPERVVHIPAGGSAVAAWPVVVGEGPEATVSMRATAVRGTRLVGRDGVEVRLPVHPLAAPQVTTQAAVLDGVRPTATLTLTLPGDALPDRSRLELRLASSLAPTLLDGLEALIGYPYGCVEQTMSKVLPNAVIARAFRELGLRNETLESDLPPMVEAGLQRLYGFQHEDGGWGWWYDDRTDIYQTAYVLLGLGLTEQAGFAVDAGVVGRGAAALERMMPAAPPDAQAYGAYALAMAGQPVSLTLTLSDALALDAFSQAALAIALDAAGRPTMTVALLDSLREGAILDETTAHWGAEDDALRSRAVLDSAVRTTALVADALARLDPNDPLLPKAVRWLMEQRRGQGWGDTQKTGFALIALTDYLLAVQEQAAAVSYRVYLNGGLWQSGELAGAQGSQTLVLTASQPATTQLTNTRPVNLQPGRNSVVVVAEGGRLYLSALLEAWRPAGEGGFSALTPHPRSITVVREYRPAGEEEPRTTFRRGDLVEVRLTLDAPEEGWYVIVEDPLPAGLEAINERLGATPHAAAYGEPRYGWEEYGYNRKEVHDDRVVFFITHLTAGRRTLTYLARAVVPGDFTALPTRVALMYEPEVWSRAAGERVTVRQR